MEPVLTALAVVAAIVAAVSIAVAANATMQVRRMGQRIEALTRGSEGKPLEGILESHLQRVYNVARDVEQMQARSRVADVRGRKAVQRVGLVRFNAFEDTAANQSFALALLDGDEDGLVLSSIHSRQATRVYAKAINAGRPDGPLSQEETEALRIARTNGAGVPD